MKTRPRYLAYLLMFICLAVLSQIETACDSGGITPREQAKPREALYEPTAEKRGGAMDASVPELARKVIVSHDITLEVDDIGPAFDSAVKLATQSGGYTTSTNRHRQPDGSFQGRISMRVPGDKAEAVMAALRKLGKSVSESSTGEDITERYIDMEARLANARASEKRLAGMMERGTANLADVLAVERELTRVRGEIESMEARKRGWDTLTRMVSITVELREPPRAMPSAHRIWHPIKTALGQAAEGFAQSLHYAIVFLGALIPWLVVLGILAYVVVRIFRRRKKKEQ